MTAGLFFALVGAAVVSLAVAQLIIAADLLKRIVAVNLLGTGMFVILVAVGYRGIDRPADPIAHALVLTGIVVAVSATGLALGLARRLRDATDKPDDV